MLFALFYKQYILLFFRKNNIRLYCEALVAYSLQRREPILMF